MWYFEKDIIKFEEIWGKGPEYIKYSTSESWPHVVLLFHDLSTFIVLHP